MSFGAIGILSLAAPAAASAQISQTLTFDEGGEGFEADRRSEGTGQLWQWSLTVGGWFIDNRDNVSLRRLLSPVYTVDRPEGGAKFDLLHAFLFDAVGTNCQDGGAVFASVDGGAFRQLAVGNGRGNYIGRVEGTFGNPLGGRQAFCGSSGSTPFLSQFSVDAALGATVQLAFVAGWDETSAEPLYSGRNWTIRELSIFGMSVRTGGEEEPGPPGTPGTPVPEPSTTMLLLPAAFMLAGTLRRRRTS